MPLRTRPTDLASTATYRAALLALLGLAAHCGPHMTTTPPLFDLDGGGTDVAQADTARDTATGIDAAVDGAAADGVAMDTVGADTLTSDGATCGDGGVACEGGCVDAQHDLHNCGGCGVVCATHPNATATCSAGVCGFVCADDFLDCNETPGDGCEVNVQTDPTHCGGCLTACNPGAQGTARCTAGVCSVVCNDGYANCDHDPANGCETNTRNDANNCSTCGSVCTTGSVEAVPACTSGVCSFSCIGGFADCNHVASDGCEINIESSQVNCGHCGQVCPPEAHSSPVCSGGTCVIRCDTGFNNCDGDTSNGCETAGICA